jgi:hypothetical protein
MLLPPKPEVPLQQGDIIRDVPFVVLPKVFNVKVEGAQGQERLDSQHLESFGKVKAFAQGKHLTAAAMPFVLQPGMVVTQGCDIDFKDDITLARVYPIGQLVVDARDALQYEEPLVLHEVIRELTEGHGSPNLVYLGLLEGLGRCIADLMRVQSFPRVWKECFHKNRWTTLTDEGVKYVQGRLSSFTGRYALAQGFWHVGEDQGLAEQAKDRMAVEQAHARLEQKKGGAAK